MTKDLINRITYHLSSGGLFNPELADHLAVRNLLMECREALAQPEQECKSPEPEARRPDVHCPDQTCGFLGECRLGYKPEQEPVALETVYETIIQWDEGGGKRSRRELARRIVSLYTTPPQRKPLTDEEIDELSRSMVKGDKSVNWLCRAIEAAHGIKGEA